MITVRKSAKTSRLFQDIHARQKVRFTVQQRRIQREGGHDFRGRSQLIAQYNKYASSGPAGPLSGVAAAGPGP